ncbi:MAG: hypothetical protein QF704_07795 [Anaerolineales bacterium]|jgi:hypothetical protein|nr:hypothetical protein [Anaerolineales bacterium]
MGYFAESFAELYNADGWIDMGMFIGAGSSAAGWWTVIAVVMLLGVLAKGNADEQEHYK